MVAAPPLDLMVMIFIGSTVRRELFGIFCSSCHALVTTANTKMASIPVKIIVRRRVTFGTGL